MKPDNEDDEEELESGLLDYLQGIETIDSGIRHYLKYLLLDYLQGIETFNKSSRLP